MFLLNKNTMNALKEKIVKYLFIQIVYIVSQLFDFFFKYENIFSIIIKNVYIKLTLR